MIRLRLTRKSTYMSAWAVMLMYTIFIQSSEFKYLLPNRQIQIACTGIATILLLIKIFVFDHFKRSTIISMACIMVLVLIVAYQGVGSKLVLYYLFIVAATGIEIPELVRFDIKIRSTMIVFLMVCSLSGLIINFNRTINGTLKFAFGWSHPNSFCGAVMLVVIEWIYLKWNKLNLKHVFVILPVFIFLFSFSESRTILNAGILIIGWAFFVRKGSRILWRSFFRGIYVFITPLMAAISWGMLYLYQRRTQLGIFLNSILTRRLNWAQRYLIRYGVSLWGTDIETVSTRESLANGTTRQIFDMSYIRLPVEYGIIYTVFFLFAFVMIQKYLVSNKRYRDIMIILYFSIVGIASTSAISLYSNYTLLLLLPSLGLDAYQKYYSKT